MPRARVWSALSPAYRARLTRSGITPSSYEAGVSLRAARGHLNTPERPEQYARNPRKYPKYAERRGGLATRIIARKKALFGPTGKLDDPRSASNVRKGVEYVDATTGDRSRAVPTLANMRAALAASDDQWFAWARSQHKEWSFLWYH